MWRPCGDETLKGSLILPETGPMAEMVQADNISGGSSPASPEA